MNTDLPSFQEDHISQFPDLQLMQNLLTGQVRVTIPHPPDEPGAKPCRKN